MRKIWAELISFGLWKITKRTWMTKRLSLSFRSMDTKTKYPTQSFSIIFIRLILRQFEQFLLSIAKNIWKLKLRKYQNRFDVFFSFWSRNKFSFCTTSKKLKLKFSPSPPERQSRSRSNLWRSFFLKASNKEYRAIMF